MKSAKTGEPLPFASIAIGNTSNGVISNENGEFIIPVKEGDDFLRVSFVGCQTRGVSIESWEVGNEKDSVIEVLLEESKISLNEVVVGSSND